MNRGNNIIKGIGLCITILLIGGAGYYFFYMRSAPVTEPTVNEVATWKTFVSSTYGVSFRYPHSYYLEEKDIDTGSGTYHQIMLYDDTEENRLVREGKSPGREGPAAITLSIYRNTGSKLSAEQWIKTVQDSNYTFSNGVLSPIVVGDTNGFSYHWSGLYEADAAAVTLKNYLYSFTVTYITPDDQIRADYGKILSSVSF